MVVTGEKHFGICTRTSSMFLGGFHNSCSKQFRIFESHHSLAHVALMLFVEHEVYQKRLSASLYNGSHRKYSLSTPEPFQVLPLSLRRIPNLCPGLLVNEHRAGAVLEKWMVPVLHLRHLRFQFSVCVVSFSAFCNNTKEQGGTKEEMLFGKTEKLEDESALFIFHEALCPDIVNTLPV